MSKEKRNKYMREVYRPRKKQEKLKKKREAKIQNYMDQLDCTREEAEDIIKTDSMM